MARILVDLDSTVVNLFDPWLAEYRRIHPDDPIGIADMIHYDSRLVARYPEDIYEPFNHPEFYRHLEFLPGAREALVHLHQAGHEMFVATAPSRNPDTAADKIRWVKEHLAFIRGDHIMLGAAKHLLKADALFDDSPDVVESCRFEWGSDLWIGGIQFPYNVAQANMWNCLAPSWKDTRAAWSQLVRSFEEHDNFLRSL